MRFPFNNSTSRDARPARGFRSERELKLLYSSVKERRAGRAGVIVIEVKKFEETVRAFKDMKC
jgi:hypothetical protein